MEYKKITNIDIQKLNSIVGENNTHIGDNIEKDLAHDELGTVFSYPEVHVVVENK